MGVMSCEKGSAINKIDAKVGVMGLAQGAG